MTTDEQLSASIAKVLGLIFDSEIGSWIDAETYYSYSPSFRERWRVTIGSRCIRLSNGVYSNKLETDYNALHAAVAVLEGRDPNLRIKRGHFVWYAEHMKQNGYLAYCAWGHGEESESETRALAACIHAVVEKEDSNEQA
jgi:hypothetical protein